MQAVLLFIIIPNKDFVLFFCCPIKIILYICRMTLIEFKKKVQKSGFKLKHIALASKIPYQSLSQIHRGERRLTPYYIDKLNKFFSK